MLVITEPNKIIDKLLLDIKKQNENKYRHFKFTHLIYVDGGCLISNLLTYQMIFLTKPEQIQYEQLVFSDDKLKSYLINSFFIVEDSFDDYKVLKQVKNMTSFFCSKKDYFDSFTILTTSDCNARCFYCYEKGCRHENMDKITADAVANYIITNSKGHPVKINWFGGEPLYNDSVIDIITNQLTVSQIDFTSKMVTNAILFDDDIIQRAVNIWNLKKVQITLDGTEKIYNKVKAYVNINTSNPFQKVIINIENLLNAGIRVIIRLNMDLYNHEDILLLINYLSERFNGQEKLKIYPAIIYDYDGKRSIDKRIELSNIFFDTCKYIDEKNMLMRSYFNNQIQYYHCMADSPTATLISPTGELGKCEHYFESHMWGNVFNNNCDISEIEEWKKQFAELSKCRNCEILPLCSRLKNCPNSSADCDIVMKEHKTKQIEYNMLNTYRRFIHKSFNQGT